MLEQPSAGQVTRPTADAAAQVVDEAEALLRLGRYHSQVVLDLDETLLLRSSTELYLDHLRPRALAQAILVVLDLLRPWRLLPGPRREHAYRDWLRVLLISTLLPWNLPMWRRVAPSLGRRHVNLPLRDAAQALSSQGAAVHVVTLGFRPIVTPLLSDMGLPTHRLIASSPWSGWRLRRGGKAAALMAAAGPDVLPSAVVVTDSLDDRDLLEGCATPLHVQWSASRWEEAFATSYQPFLYTRRGKRAGQKYLLHHVLLEDVLLLVLALCWSMPQPVLGAAGLLLLHLSFWTIYEIGYWENDTLAVRRERRPSVPPGSADAATRMKPRWAWVSAAVLAVPGVVLLVEGAGDRLRNWTSVAGDGTSQVLVLLAGWLLYLLLSRAVYWGYNRLDPRARSLPYAALQTTRTVGYCALCLVSPVGVAALLAIVFVRWMIYVCYRATGLQPDVSHRLLLLFSFLVLLTGAAALDAAALYRSPQAAVILALLVLRAHRPLRQVMRLVSAGTSDAHPPSPPSPAAPQSPAPSEDR